MLCKSQEEQSILPKSCIWDLNCSHMQLMYQQLVVEKQGLGNSLLSLLLYIITKYIDWTAHLSEGLRDPRIYEFLSRLTNL